MSQHTRARSLSRERVIKRTDLFPGGEALDPVALLGDLLNKITDLDAPLSVTISDNSSSVTYLLSAFISKEYEVIDDTVKFGLKRLKTKELRANVSFEIQISSDD
jgi:hypothetical protein